MSSKKKLGVEKKGIQTPAKKLNNLRASLSKKQKKDKEEIVSSQTARLDGDGAVALGDHPVAVGRDGTYIGGSVTYIDKSSDPTKEDASERKRLTTAFQDYIEKLKGQMEGIRKKELSTSPYKALSEYEFQDETIFFGRVDMVKKLITHINQSRLTILSAESGAGKSSILQAGVEPGLVRLDHVPLYIRPVDTPVHIKIKQTLLPRLSRSHLLDQASLRDFLHLVTSQLKKSRWLVIIVDQFEEFFTLQKDEDRQTFIKELAGCLSDKTLPVRWVLSIKGEESYKLVKYHNVLRYSIEDTILLNFLTENEATEIITKPAQKFGVDYEDQVIKEIKENLLQGTDSSVNRISPPELQLVCSALYDSRGENKLITLEMFNQLGGTKGILQDHLERELDNFPGKQRVLARQILLSLVSSKGSRNIRSIEDISLELSSKATNASGLKNILEQLVDLHLLRKVERDNEGVDDPAYELSHEYLVEKIELNDEYKKQKIAREILEFKLEYKLKLTSSELKIIKPYEGVVVLKPEAKQLVQDSKREVNFRQLELRMLSLFASGITFSVVIFIAIIIIKITPQIVIQGYVSLITIVPIGFAVSGLNRKWAKELLVTFSMILALTINTLLKHLPIIENLPVNSTSLFWIQTMVVIALVYFGYQTEVIVPNLVDREINSRRLQDSLFGGILGAINGYFMIGTIWFYLDQTGYTSLGFSPPEVNTIGAAYRALAYMPPHLFGEPGIYFAVILMLIFVIVVYGNEINTKAAI